MSKNARAKGRTKLARAILKRSRFSSQGFKERLRVWQ